VVPSIGVVSIALLIMSAPAELHRRRNALAYGDKAGLVARVGFDENARPYGDCRSVGRLEVVIGAVGGTVIRKLLLPPS
jgi:hypothetical protein